MTTRARTRTPKARRLCIDRQLGAKQILRALAATGTGQTKIAAGEAWLAGTGRAVSAVELADAMAAGRTWPDGTLVKVERILAEYGIEWSPTEPEPAQSKRGKRGRRSGRVSTPRHDAAVERLKADPDLQAAAEHGRRWEEALRAAFKTEVPYRAELHRLADKGELVGDEFEYFGSLQDEAKQGRTEAMEAAGFKHTEAPKSNLDPELAERAAAVYPESAQPAPATTAAASASAPPPAEAPRRLRQADLAILKHLAEQKARVTREQLAEVVEIILCGARDPKTIKAAVDRLLDRGYISEPEGKGKGLEITSEGQRFLSDPR